MESGTTHWNESVIIDGTNETGFTGLPGGFRNATGAFSSIGQKGFYWSSSGGVYPCYVWYQDIYYSDRHTSPSSDLASEKGGRSVRCIKDN